MNIDIANMALTIGEKTEGIDWGEAVVTLGSVFLGALLAYQCSKLLERHQHKKQEATNYDILSTQMALSLDNFLTYKKVYLDRTKEAFTTNNIEEALKTSYIPDAYFSFDFEKYYFLTTYNRCFLPALSLLKKTGLLTLEEIPNYYQNVFKVLYLRDIHDQTFRKEYNDLKNRFLFLYKEFEQLCARIYTINKIILMGYEKYFNPYNYEGLVDNFELETSIDRHLNKDAIDFIDTQLNTFNPYWMLSPNIYCYLCLLKRRIKRWLTNFVQYFHKPEICKQCRCRNLKKQRKDK